MEIGPPFIDAQLTTFSATFGCTRLDISSAGSRVPTMAFGEPGVRT